MTLEVPGWKHYICIVCRAETTDPKWDSGFSYCNTCFGQRRYVFCQKCGDNLCNCGIEVPYDERGDD